MSELSNEDRQLIEKINKQLDELVPLACESGPMPWLLQIAAQLVAVGHHRDAAFRTAQDLITTYRQLKNARTTTKI